MIDGKKFCRVSGTWMDPEEHARIYAVLEERAFMRGANQGELSTPMVITDGQAPLQSMTDGKIYDSKSAMRAEYRRAGVQEVGNDAPVKKATETHDDRRRAKEERRGAIGRALSHTGFGA